MESITAPAVAVSIISFTIVRERHLAVAVAALAIAIGMVSYVAALETVPDKLQLRAAQQPLLTMPQHA